jgi:hypothetical protein
MIDVLTPVAALVAGLAGSAHCVLMCGGIASALGLGTHAGQACAGNALRYPILYNFGRLTSYTAAGAAAGALGGGALALAGLARLHTAFAVLAAVVVTVAGLRAAAGARHFGWLDRAGAQAWQRIAPLTRGLFPVTTPVRAYGVGLAWGWLPCGMAYAMLTAAMLSADVARGAALMAMFGLGTLPAMLALGGGAARLLGPRLRRAGGVLLVTLGLASGFAALHEGTLHEGTLPDFRRGNRGASPHAASPHSHAAAGAVLGVNVTGELPQPNRVEDTDRPALDLDHAELSKP